MNRKYYFCLISLVLIGSIFLSACDTEKRKADEKELQEKLTNLLNSDPDEEKVTLLAIKYKTDPQVVCNIVDSYLTSHEFVSLKEIFDKDNKLEKDTNKSTKPTIIETIHNLSVKHQIAEDVLVSIIIDYQIWTAAEGDY